MKFTIYMSTNKRERQLGTALKMGIEKHGHKVEFNTREEFWKGGVEKDSEIIGFVGVKSRKIWQDTVAAGKIPMIIDKGYFGNANRSDNFRISLGTFQPDLKLFPNDPNRLKKLGVLLKPWRKLDEPQGLVVYAGSSEKYCLFHGISDPTEYAKDVCGQLVKVTKGKKLVVMYRPKPSWWAKTLEATPDPVQRSKLKPDGTTLSDEPLLASLLPSTHCLVTHGSNSAVEALAAGIPVIVLGGSLASPVYKLGSESVGDVLKPFYPDYIDRNRVISQLAWSQFNLEEFTNGFAWGTVADTQLPTIQKYGYVGNQ